LVKLVGK